MFLKVFSSLSLKMLLKYKRFEDLDEKFYIDVHGYLFVLLP